MSIKIPITPSEIEPATFPLVAQCLRQLARGRVREVVIILKWVLKKCEVLGAVE